MNTVKIFGKHDDKTLQQLKIVSNDAERSALMADGHLGHYMPIGGVAAYDNKVSIAGVGVDISCGNCAIKLDMQKDKIENSLSEIADEIFTQIGFGGQRENTADDSPHKTGQYDYIFNRAEWLAIPHKHREKLCDYARKQLGTVGGGNHYVDVFYDDENYIWVGVHFGSRHLGASVSNNFLAFSAGEPWGAKVKTPGLVHLENPIGHDYWRLMQLCGIYAYAGRDWVTQKVAKIIGADIVDYVHNHHNYAWKERHFNKDYVVVRKGATPAFPGEFGFVGSSMGEPSVILKGKTHKEGSREQWVQKQALFSTVHGAGRLMSRTHAKKTVNHDDVKAWIHSKNIIVRGGGLDQAPQAYKRLEDVIRYQDQSIEVVRTLYPLIVCMAPDSSLSL